MTKMVDGLYMKRHDRALYHSMIKVFIDEFMMMMMMMMMITMMVFRQSTRSYFVAYLICYVAVVLEFSTLSTLKNVL